MRLISNGWMNYLKKVLPANAPQVQVEECRQAFYAGAVVVFELLVDIGNGDPKDDEPEVQKLEALRKELLEYVQSVTGRKR